MKTEVEYMGRSCSCYGELEENSNFEMVFDNEELDDVWCEGNPIDGGKFGSWYDAVVAITDAMGEMPAQLEAV